MKYPNGSETVHSSGPWMQLIAVKKALCSDGIARRAKITGQPDTFFSIPASVKVRGKTVTGYITNAPDYKQGVLEGHIFCANRDGKNSELLPRGFDWDKESTLTLV